MDLMDYRRKIIANSPHLMSASGAVASFSDGDDLPLKSLLVDIEPVQSGSGDPSPDNVRPISGWDAIKVTRSGKNLTSPYINGTVESYGLTLTLNQDGSIRISGTATNTSAVLLSMKNVSIPLKAGTYTFNNGLSDSYGKVYAQCLTSSGAFYSRYAPQTKTFSEDVVVTRLDIGINSANGESIDVTVFPQLEIGSTATPYEPYNGVTVTIDLGQTVYGGTLNPLTGVMMVTHISDTQKLSAYNVVSTGTNTVHYRLFDSAFNTSLPQNPDSGNFSNVAKNVYNSGDTTHFYPNISNGRIELWLPIGTDTNADVQIVCKLATPYEIQLTPHQIRSLYGNNTIFADTGNMALEYWAHP